MKYALSEASIMERKTYDCQCILIHEDPTGPYEVTLSGGGDVLRLECPPHLLGKFILGERYVLTLALQMVERGCSPRSKS